MTQFDKIRNNMLIFQFLLKGSVQKTTTIKNQSTASRLKVSGPPPLFQNTKKNKETGSSISQHLVAMGLVKVQVTVVTHTHANTIKLTVF